MMYRLSGVDDTSEQVILASMQKSRYGPETLEELQDLSQCPASNGSKNSPLTVLGCMNHITDTEAVVKDSLLHFAKTHMPSAQLSLIDEIVLSYVVSIVEDLGQETSVEEAFDSESFCEMMEGYFPEFSSISKATVCKWMIELASSLSKRSNHDVFSYLEASLAVPPSGVIKKQAPSRSHSNSESEDTCLRRSPRMSETSETGSDSGWDGFNGGRDGDNLESYEEQIPLLQEMFPTACELEVKHCLTIAGGNVENAAQLMLHRQESGDSITHSSKSILQQTNQKKSVLGEKALRDKIVARYGFIDKDEDQREYKPVAPKPEPKKLIRYRDNVIVSMKGERFSEVKKEETEAMKKTYVNLKPARQYRFH